MGCGSSMQVQPVGNADSKYHHHQHSGHHHQRGNNEQNNLPGTPNDSSLSHSETGSSGGSRPRSPEALFTRRNEATGSAQGVTTATLGRTVSGHSSATGAGVPPSSGTVSTVNSNLSIAFARAGYHAAASEAALNSSTNPSLIHHFSRVGTPSSTGKHNQPPGAPPPLPLVFILNRKHVVCPSCLAVICTISEEAYASLLLTRELVESTMVLQNNINNNNGSGTSAVRGISEASMSLMHRSRISDNSTSGGDNAHGSFSFSPRLSPHNSTVGGGGASGTPATTPAVPQPPPSLPPPSVKTADGDELAAFSAAHCSAEFLTATEEFWYVQQCLDCGLPTGHSRWITTSALLLQNDSEAGSLHNGIASPAAAPAWATTSMNAEGVMEQMFRRGSVLDGPDGQAHPQNSEAFGSMMESIRSPRSAAAGLRRRSLQGAFASATSVDEPPATGAAASSAEPPASSSPKQPTAPMPHHHAMAMALSRSGSCSVSPADVNATMAASAGTPGFQSPAPPSQQQAQQTAAAPQGSPTKGSSSRRGYPAGSGSAAVAASKRSSRPREITFDRPPSRDGKVTSEPSPLLHKFTIGFRNLRARVVHAVSSEEEREEEWDVVKPIEERIRFLESLGDVDVNDDLRAELRELKARLVHVRKRDRRVFDWVSDTMSSVDRQWLVISPTLASGQGSWMPVVSPRMVAAQLHSAGSLEQPIVEFIGSAKHPAAIATFGEDSGSSFANGGGNESFRTSISDSRRAGVDSVLSPKLSVSARSPFAPTPSETELPGVPMASGSAGPLSSPTTILTPSHRSRTSGGLGGMTMLFPSVTSNALALLQNEIVRHPERHTHAAVMAAAAAAAQPVVSPLRTPQGGPAFAHAGLRPRRNSVQSPTLPQLIMPPGGQAAWSVGDRETIGGTEGVSRDLSLLSVPGGTATHLAVDDGSAANATAALAPVEVRGRIEPVEDSSHLRAAAAGSGGAPQLERKPSCGNEETLSKWMLKEFS